MGAQRRWLPGTIAGQITALVIVAVLLGVGLASAVLLYLIDQGQTGPNSEVLAAVRAARIAAIVKEATATKSKDQISHALRGVHSNTVEVSVVPAAGLTEAAGAPPAPPLIAAVETGLRETWELQPLRRVLAPGDLDAVFLRLDAQRALRFEIFPRGGFYNLLIAQTIFALAIVVFITLFLSIYAVRWIVAPLSLIASAAHSFGRAGSAEAELGVDGPREIAQAARALNDMRKRVRTLVDERTQMLVAIGHDLRTPLTRLRLRVERLTDEAPRAAMLQDIVTVNAMLGETLAYLREDSQPEEASLVDLPSLLQTIAAQFSDVGSEVAYRGPDHLTFAGRPQAICRAVTNIVENATKFGTRADVALLARDDGAVDIEITDDGPGIAPALREHVFEPFFKGDSARTVEGRSGFGLGLTIARNVVEQHGGSIELADREPHGLRVRMTLAPLPPARVWEVASAA